MKTSSMGIELIKEFESCRLFAYDDLQPNVLLTANTKIKGKLTIGYGHTGLVRGEPITWCTTITKSEAVALLHEDLVRFEKNVSKYNLKYKWTQNEFDALVCFAFNVGSINQLTALGTRSRKTILQKFTAYNKVLSNGKKVPCDGLTRRRKSEQALFSQ